MTGASTADLAIILVDARNGLERAVAAARLPDHAAAGAAPGARGEQDGPGRLRPAGLRGASATSSRSSRPSSRSPDLTFIPISALNGDNVVERSAQHALVRRPVAAAPPGARAHRLGPEPHRRAVPGAVRDQAAREQRPELHDYRGYAGQVAGGVLKPGDEVLHLPSGFSTQDQPDRARGQGGRRGVPAHVGDPAARRRRGHLPRRHDLPAEQPAQVGPGHRGHGLLDERGAAAHRRGRG